MRGFQGWRQAFDDFVDEHRGPILFLASLFVIGVVFGALAVRSLEPTDKQELVRYLGATLGSLEHPPEGATGLLLRRALVGNVRLLAILWVLGVSMVGILGVMGLTLFRGFVTGFVVAFLAAEMGLPGVALALAGHVPQSLLEVPALILAGTASMGLSARLFRTWRERRRMEHVYPALASYTGTLLLAGVVLAGAGLVEGYFAPLLVRLAATFLKAH